jgi:glycosyltransferase involved in cell wall biosynthesis
LVPVKDVEALANALQRLRSDTGLRHALGEAARARANSELTEALMTEKFERVFNARLSF